MAVDAVGSSSATGLSRRRFLTAAAVAGAGTIGIGVLRSGAWAGTASRMDDYPFTLGVASGDPTSDGFVIWTRVRPDPSDPAALSGQVIPVQWEVFADEGLRSRVAGGLVVASDTHAHAVHVDVAGLRPDRWYWYRFRTAHHDSPVGRSRTFPSVGSPGGRMRVAVAACQMYEHGYFTAYQHMLNDDLDLVVHTGDYIYESAAGQSGFGDGTVRPHDGPETVDLAGYRDRHALYKTDPDLQAAHAVFPFVTTWDDHEVENNYAGAVPMDGGDRVAFARRRAAAVQAYHEHMPLRRSARRSGAHLYRHLGYGDLVSMSVLDTRQFRSDQACGDGSERDVPCDEWTDATRTMLGARQERWLLDRLAESRTRWNVIGQQVFMAQRDTLLGEGKRVSMDSWDGYPAARRRLLTGIAERRIANVVALSGDVHRHWAADLTTDFDDPSAATIGAELVCTAITSGGDGSDDRADDIRAENPHIHYCASRRGYLRCDVTRDEWRAEFLTMPYVSRRGAPIGVDATYVIESGRPGAQAS